MNRVILMVVAGVTAGPMVAQAYDPAGTPDDWDPPMGGGQTFWRVLGDRLETGFSDDEAHYLWDIQGWYGGDYNRAVFKTEGEGEFGQSPEEAEVQLLYSRLFAAFWEWQVGVRHDLRPEPERSHLVLGLQGVLPYEFEWDSAVFLSDEGILSGRIEAEYDINVTQRWYLQPRLEINFAFSDDPEIHQASGLNETELGLRLHYQIRREFAPYIGLEWKQLYGDQKALARAEEESTSETALVVGVRFWF